MIGHIHGYRVVRVLRVQGCARFWLGCGAVVSCIVTPLRTQWFVTWKHIRAQPTTRLGVGFLLSEAQRSPTTTD